MPTLQLATLLMDAGPYIESNLKVGRPDNIISNSVAAGGFV